MVARIWTPGQFARTRIAMYAIVSHGNFRSNPHPMQATDIMADTAIATYQEHPSKTIATQEVMHSRSVMSREMAYMLMLILYGLAQAISG